MASPIRIQPYTVIEDAINDLIGFGDEITPRTMVDLGIEVNAGMIKSDRLKIIYPLPVKEILGIAIPKMGLDQIDAQRILKMIEDLGDALDDCVALTSVARYVESVEGRKLDDGTLLDNQALPLEYPYFRLGDLCKGRRLKNETLDVLIRSALRDPTAIILDLHYMRGLTSEYDVKGGDPLKTMTYGTYNYMLLLETMTSAGEELRGANPLLELGLVFEQVKDSVLWVSTMTLPNRVVAYENATSLDLINRSLKGESIEDRLDTTTTMASQNMSIQARLMAGMITTQTKFGVSSNETFKINVRESGWQEIGDMEPKLPVRLLQNPLPGGLLVTWDAGDPGDMHLLIKDGKMLCRINTREHKMAWALSLTDMVDKDGYITTKGISNAIGERINLSRMIMERMDDVLQDVGQRAMDLLEVHDAQTVEESIYGIRGMMETVEGLLPNLIDGEAYVGIPFSENLTQPKDDNERDDLATMSRRLVDSGLRMMLMLQMPYYWKKVLMDSGAPNTDLSLERVLANPKNRKRRFRFGSDKIRFIYPKSDKPKKQRKYHPVRGHTRVLKNGRETQVIPHWRGNPKIGTIQGIMAIGEAKRGPWSEVALEWLRSIEGRLGRKIRHHRNGGEYRIPHTNLRVDGWDEETGTIYEFHGDYWHGNPDVYPEDMPHPDVKGKTMGDLYRATMEKEQLLRDMEYRVVSIWENDWRNS